MRDDDPDYPAIAIGGYMLRGGFLNSRLATRIRQKEGLSYGVGGGFSASPLDNDASFSAQMFYTPQNVEKLGSAFAKRSSAPRGKASRLKKSKPPKPAG